MGTLTPHLHHWTHSRWQRSEILAATARQERRAIEPLSVIFGDRRLAQLGPWLVTEWMAERHHLAASTLAMQFRQARRFFRWLHVEHGAPDPFLGLRPPRVPRQAPVTLDRGQVAALFAVAPHSRARVAVALGVHLGLRRAEICGLRHEDWSRHARTLRVTGKGGHVRELPMVDEVERELARYLAEHPAHRGPLLRTFTTGGPLSPATLSCEFWRLAAAAEVKVGCWDGVGLHALRRTCASDVLEAGADVRLVQNMLGHQQLSSTEHYLRRAELGRMRDAMSGRSYLDLPPAA